MVAAIYQGGELTASDARQTALALGCYAAGLAGYATVKILAPAFYALHDARTPTLVSLLSIAVNYFAVAQLVRLPGLGHAGLAAATSVVAIFNGAALLWAIRRRAGGIHGGDLLRSVSKVTAASALMGAACFASSHLTREWLGVARWARIADLAISIPIGISVFYALASALGVEELSMVKAALARSSVIE